MVDDSIAPLRIGWAYLEGYPWWPVYICDPDKLREQLHNGQTAHRAILQNVRRFKDDYRLVYYLNSYDFSKLSVKKNYVRPWNCEKAELFKKGFPKNTRKNEKFMKQLKGAMEEAEELIKLEFLERVPVQLEKSDLDNTMTPPPEMAVEEVEDLQENDEDGESEASEEKSESENEEKMKKEQQMKELKLIKLKEKAERKRKREEEMEARKMEKVAAREESKRRKKDSLKMEAEMELKRKAKKELMKEAKNDVQMNATKDLKIDAKKDSKMDVKKDSKVEAKKDSKVETKKDSIVEKGSSMGTNQKGAEGNKEEPVEPEKAEEEEALIPDKEISITELPVSKELKDEDRSMLFKEIQKMARSTDLAMKSMRWVREDLEKNLNRSFATEKRFLKACVILAMERLDQLKQQHSMKKVAVRKPKPTKAKKSPKKVVDRQSMAHKLGTNLTPDKEVLKILHTLSETKLTVEQLGEFNLSRKVANLRNHRNRTIAALARDIRRNWKSQAETSLAEQKADDKKDQPMTTGSKKMNQPKTSPTAKKTQASIIQKKTEPRTNEKNKKPLVEDKLEQKKDSASKMDSSNATESKTSPKGSSLDATKSLIKDNSMLNDDDTKNSDRDTAKSKPVSDKLEPNSVQKNTESVSKKELALSKTPDSSIAKTVENVKLTLSKESSDNAMDAKDSSKVTDVQPKTELVKKEPDMVDASLEKIELKSEVKVADIILKKDKQENFESTVSPKQEKLKEEAIPDTASSKQDILKKETSAASPQQDSLKKEQLAVSPKHEVVKKEKLVDAVLPKKGAGVLKKRKVISPNKDSLKNEKNGDQPTRVNEKIISPQPASTSSIRKQDYTRAIKDEKSSVEECASKLESGDLSSEETLHLLQTLKQCTTSYTELQKLNLPQKIKKIKASSDDFVSAAATEVFRLWKSKFKNDPASENKREHGDDNPVDVKRQKKNPVDDTPGDLLSSVSILSDEKSTTANKMTVLKKLLKMTISVQELKEFNLGKILAKLRKTSSNTEIAEASKVLYVKLKKNYEQEAKSKN